VFSFVLVVFWGWSYLVLGLFSRGVGLDLVYGCNVYVCV